MIGILVAGLAACGANAKYSEQYKDAPVGERNSQPADLLTFPDGYSNVAAKCDGTTRVYVIFHQDGAYGSVAAVANSPECAG